jgi:Zn-dependent protease
MSYPRPEPDPEAGAEPQPRYPLPPSPYQPPDYNPGQYSGWYQQAPPSQAQPRAARNGLAGWLTSLALGLFAVLKYGGLLLFKIPALTTLITLLISFGTYTLFAGPVAAAGIVVMIFLHEMGHVIEIRRQGMQATAPVFIPFMGAAIFQRSHPQDALRQAQIGIAGPVAGTVASIAALVLYSSTGFKFLLAWAAWGFFVNLFNMIPFGMLDGGWVLAAASKWFQVLGIGALAVAVFFLHLYFSPFLIILLVMAIPTVIERFRNDASPYYQSVPLAARWLMGFAWLGLVAVLGFGLMQTAALAGFLR